MLKYHSIDIFEFLSNSIPIYTYRSNMIRCEHIDIIDEDTLLQIQGIHRVEVSMEFDTFFDEIIKEISENNPVLITLYLDEVFDMCFLAIGYDEYGSLMTICRQHPETLSYAKRIVSKKEIADRYEHKITDHRIDITAVMVFPKIGRIKYCHNDSESRLKNFLMNHALNEHKIYSGLEALVVFADDFTKLIIAKNDVNYNDLINAINDVICSCRVTTIVLNEYCEKDELINKKKNVEKKWSFLRNKLIKSQLSQQKIKDASFFFSVLMEIFYEECIFFRELLFKYNEEVS